MRSSASSSMKYNIEINTLSANAIERKAEYILSNETRPSTPGSPKDRMKGTSLRIKRNSDNQQKIKLPPVTESLADIDQSIASTSVFIPNESSLDAVAAALAKGIEGLLERLPKVHTTSLSTPYELRLQDLKKKVVSRNDSISPTESFTTPKELTSSSSTIPGSNPPYPVATSQESIMYSYGLDPQEDPNDYCSYDRSVSAPVQGDLTEGNIHMYMNHGYGMNDYMYNMGGNSAGYLGNNISILSSPTGLHSNPGMMTNTNSGMGIAINTHIAHPMNSGMTMAPTSNLGVGGSYTSSNANPVGTPSGMKSWNHPRIYPPSNASNSNACSKNNSDSHNAVAHNALSPSDEIPTADLITPMLARGTPKSPPSPARGRHYSPYFDSSPGNTATLENSYATSPLPSALGRVFAKKKAHEEMEQ